jgi:sulfur-carrier protein adenylyltransferase/sulfurtransferase
VLGVLPGVIGIIQATETLKFILGKGTSLLNRLLLFDALEMRFRELKLRRDPQCPLCSENRTITRLIDYEAFCGAPPPAMTPALHPDEVSVQDLKHALGNPQLGIEVLDVREPGEYQIARINGARLLPMSTLAQRFTELDASQSYYIYCRTGSRSLLAVQFLREHGFQQLKSVQGGIKAWSEEIDPTVPTY